jgi:hypothetical protein
MTKQRGARSTDPMDDRSTISWMIMGGPRYDEHSQARMDHVRALEEQRLQYKRARRGGRLARLVGFFDSWTSKPASALTADYCTVDGCAAA